MAQEAELGVCFDTVVVCTVTGSTQAGMTAPDMADRIGLGLPLREEAITLLRGSEGSACALPDEATIEAIHLAARTQSMLTDPHTKASPRPG